MKVNGLCVQLLTIKANYRQLYDMVRIRNIAQYDSSLNFQDAMNVIASQIIRLFTLSVIAPTESLGHETIGVYFGQMIFIDLRVSICAYKQI